MAVGSRSAHILRMPGISSGKRPPGLIYHQRAQRNDFWLRAATRANFLTTRDLDFDGGQMNVVRSVVQGVISSCKTETSMKPIPMGPYLADMLKKWKDEAVYVTPNDWVFASVRTQTEPNAKEYSSGSEEIGDQQANRLAHISTLVLKYPSVSRNRYKGSAGSA